MRTVKSAALNNKSKKEIKNILSLEQEECQVGKNRNLALDQDFQRILVGEK